MVTETDTDWWLVLYEMVLSGSRLYQRFKNWNKNQSETIAQRPCPLHVCSFVSKSKWEHLANSECVLFHFKSSFRSRENQILKFQIKQEIQAQNKKYILLNNLGSLLMNFDQYMSYPKKKNFIKKLYKNCGLKTSFRSFFVFAKN